MSNGQALDHLIIHCSYFACQSQMNKNIQTRASVYNMYLNKQRAFFLPKKRDAINFIIFNKERNSFWHHCHLNSFRWNNFLRRFLCSRKLFNSHEIFTVSYSHIDTMHHWKVRPQVFFPIVLFLFLMISCDTHRMCTFCRAITIGLQTFWIFEHCIDLNSVQECMSMLQFYMSLFSFFFTV